MIIIMMAVIILIVTMMMAAIMKIIIKNPITMKIIIKKILNWFKDTLKAFDDFKKKQKSV